MVFHQLRVLIGVVKSVGLELLFLGSNYGFACVNCVSVSSPVKIGIIVLFNPWGCCED